MPPTITQKSQFVIHENFLQCYFSTLGTDYSPLWICLWAPSLHSFLDFQMFSTSFLWLVVLSPIPFSCCWPLCQSVSSVLATLVHMMLLDRQTDCHKNKTFSLKTRSGYSSHTNNCHKCAVHQILHHLQEHSICTGRGNTHTHNYCMHANVWYIYFCRHCPIQSFHDWYNSF